MGLLNRGRQEALSGGASCRCVGLLYDGGREEAVGWRCSGSVL